MPQVYAVVYDENGRFLMAQKNERGYFFHNSTDGTTGTILPAGNLLNGSGKRALPGGKLPSGVDAQVQAAIEFMEETNITLNSNVLPWLSQPFDSNQYYGVYFKVTADVLDTILSTATTNLNAGNNG